MKALLSSLDALLRGRFTRREEIQAGRIDVPVRTLVVLSLLLGMVYGLCMGLYGVVRPGDASYAQLIATTFKVPLLFLLTLMVTFPSLYVFSALADSRLRSTDTLRLLLVAISVNLAVLAAFGTITAFFTLSTDSYPFMVILNVLFFGVAGLIGLGFLRGALDAVFAPRETAPPPPVPVRPTDAEGGETDEDAVAAPMADTVRAAEADYRRERRSRRIFGLWTVIYAIVGAQMGWVLRPFVGSPGQAFELFRARESNFFTAFLETLQRLFG